MLELPELETARRDLDREIGGLKIKEVDVLGPKRLIPGQANKNGLTKSLSGRKISSVKRVGMLICLDVGSGESLVINLGPGGTLRRAVNKDQKEPDTQLIITFTQKGQLRLLDGEKSATVNLVQNEEIDQAFPEVAELGFDPVDEPISWTDFGRRLLECDTKLRPLLMDQTFVVGLGPIYSDEILHAALLRHDRVANQLITQEIRRLYRSIVETIHNAVKHRGVSLDQISDVFGEPGGYDEYLEVYGRGGERSRNGRGDVLTARVGGTTHYYCDYQV
ncbi:MAG: DNA-formamidopyrimidine glycosylase family protein [Acidimicrobiales bacterium]|jgi:formamidopyrimidine-DNA glycosylase|nr:DNA-formamidopyrimidine glycosylase family protein [Actinomycetota bacterium]MEC9089412.1 DNA-formamidopyrimidine glycosylase family protein [Actinomycetota bacterium]HAE53655.1 hypothetical protein [Acidimicrobiaceae bacterium]HBU40068.1 hypothetical protein [Acidimicrobiaceae bacterium]|tara:strand:+ start:13100 stop:13930 length:831 start_codon:yes stop_codon:yes gene_type:complete